MEQNQELLDLIEMLQSDGVLFLDKTEEMAMVVEFLVLHESKAIVEPTFNGSYSYKITYVPAQEDTMDKDKRIEDLTAERDYVKRALDEERETWEIQRQELFDRMNSFKKVIQAKDKIIQEIDKLKHIISIKEDEVETLHRLIIQLKADIYDLEHMHD